MAKKDKLELSKYDKSFENPYSPFFPETPLRMLVIGSSNSGKTYATIHDILLAPECPFNFILWIAPKTSLKQPKMMRLFELINVERPENIIREDLYEIKLVDSEEFDSIK